jgi:hypothetical protein
MNSGPEIPWVITQIGAKRLASAHAGRDASSRRFTAE